MSHPEYLAQFLSTLRFSNETCGTTEHVSGTIARLSELYGRLSENEKAEAVEHLKHDDLLMNQVANLPPFRPVFFPWFQEPSGSFV